MISYNFNPHSYHNNSNRVKSQVVSLALKDDNGKDLRVSNLPSDIQINIPLSQTVPGNTTRTDYFLNPGDMQYYVVTAEEVNASFKVSMELQKPALVTAYIKYGEQPTKHAYDKVINFKIEDEFESTKWDCNSTERCSRSILIRCSYPGEYFIGLVFDSKNGEVRSRNRRSLLSEEGSQGKCVTFKDPPPTVPTPVESSIILPQYDPGISLNYSLIVEGIWCAYWSVDQEQWSNEGCKVRNSRLLFVKKRG